MTGVPAVSVTGLRKSYGDHEAVKGISFDVPAGSFFAFLGPNGAGKSTTISVITSLVSADSGDVKVFGLDPSDQGARSRMGVVFQDPKMDKVLTVRENVSIRGSMYGLSGKDLGDAVDRALATSGCEEFSGQRYGELSGGQRRRADIARALVHGPELLVLDEPTTGLDPATRKMIWELIGDLNRTRGLTVLLTTHYMEEAAGADDIVIIDHGEISVHGTPAQIRDRFCSDRMEFVPKDADTARRVLDGVDYSEDKGRFVIPLKRTADCVPLFASLGDNIESVEVRSGTLDEAFIAITGEGSR